MDENNVDILEAVGEDEAFGNIKIAQDVVATIAGLATADIEGIAGMSGGISDGIAQILGRKQLTKGVKVEVADTDAKIDLFVIVEYGCRINEVAKKVQEAVKAAVENMTGLVVSSINVNVQGIAFAPQEQVVEEETTVE